MSNVINAGLIAGAFLLVFHLSLLACSNALKTGRVPDKGNHKYFPRVDRKKNPQWFWFNFIPYTFIPVAIWVALSFLVSHALR